MEKRKKHPDDDVEYILDKLEREGVCTEILAQFVERAIARKENKNESST